jgi:hypothetical protein
MSEPVMSPSIEEMRDELAEEVLAIDFQSRYLTN